MMLVMIIMILTPDGKMLCIMDVLDNGTVKMKEYADDGALQKKVLSSPFAVFAPKYKSTTKVRAVMHGFLEQNIVDKPSFFEIYTESQARYAVNRLYATSKLPAIELQTQPRPGLFAKQTYRNAESELVVWGKVMLTDTSVPGKAARDPCSLLVLRHSQRALPRPPRRGQSLATLVESPTFAASCGRPPR